MTYLKLEALSTVTAPNHKNLLAAWKLYGDSNLVKTFKCEAPLTDAQRRRLPVGLREVLAA